jgi:hypothetical protein
LNTNHRFGLFVKLVFVEIWIERIELGARVYGSGWVLVMFWI